MRKASLLKVLILAALYPASSAWAGQVLWHKIEIGMTPEQVKALEPNLSKIDKDDCQYTSDDLHIGSIALSSCVNFKDGKVFNVRLFEPRIKYESYGVLKAALAENYGSPVIEDQCEPGTVRTCVTMFRKSGLSVRLRETKVMGMPRTEILYEGTSAAANQL